MKCLPQANIFEDLGCIVEEGFPAAPPVPGLPAAPALPAAPELHVRRRVAEAVVAGDVLLVAAAGRFMPKPGAAERPSAAMKMRWSSDLRRGDMLSPVGRQARSAIKPVRQGRGPRRSIGAAFLAGNNVDVLLLSSPGLGTTVRS